MCLSLFRIFIVFIYSQKAFHEFSHIDDLIFHPNINSVPFSGVLCIVQ